MNSLQLTFLIFAQVLHFASIVVLTVTVVELNPRRYRLPIAVAIGIYSSTLIVELLSDKTGILMLIHNGDSDYVSGLRSIAVSVLLWTVSHGLRQCMIHRLMRRSDK